MCQQETKRDSFDLAFIKKFCPAKLNDFAFVPSVGASGGMIICWDNGLFDGHLSFSNNFVVSVDFYSRHNGDSRTFTNIYAPCTPMGKCQFIDWFKNVKVPDDIHWLIVGDFNLIGKPEDRNKPGADIQEVPLHS